MTGTIHAFAGMGGGVDYSQCCLRHDLAYWSGLPRIEADLARGLCVAQAGLPALGASMAAATMAFGWLFYRAIRLGGWRHDS